MAATIYTRTRELIGDGSSPYTISDDLIYLYLDEALKKASEIAGYRYIEDVAISESDITNGYVELTYDPIQFINKAFGTQHVDYEFGSYNQVRFVNSSNWTAQTLNDVEYRRYFVRFKGSSKEDSALDHPAEANLAICHYAIGKYLIGQGIVDADGDMSIVQSKSEEGMSITYGLDSSILSYGSPKKLMSQAVGMMRELPNARPNIWSVKI